jgi:two-component system sensor histidine kinase PilS (NtrC family)
MGTSTPLLAQPAWSPRDANDKRLLWLTFLRVAIVTVLLGSTIVIHFTGASTPLPAYLYALVAVVYLLTLVYALLLHRRVAHKVQAILQVGGDIAVYSVLVYLTGGAESAFTFIYSLAIINAAILLYRRGALVTATICTGVFGALVALEGAQVLPPFDSAAVLDRSALGAFNTVFTNAAAFFFVALLSSFLAEQLRATETALAEARGGLESLRALSENILRSIADGLVTADDQGHITYANTAALEILGRTNDTLLGQPLTLVFPSFGEDEGIAGAFVRRYREVSIVRPDGGRAVLGLSASAMRDATQRQLGWLLVFHDLSVLKAMEVTIQRSERLAAMGRLAADMAHEIRNPLASISGAVELMGRDGALPQESQGLMSIVVRETERLDKLIGDFLDYARPRAPDVAPFDLAEVVTDTLEMFRHQRFAEREPELVVDVQGPIPIEADLHQVKQVLWNLLQNSAESLAAGGRITVRAHVAERQGAVLEVEDTGSGISPDDLPHLFEPFYTTKERGTGLGLATVHRIVESHGGRIEVTSALGERTRFVVHLPARPPGPPSAGGVRTAEAA